MVAKELAYSSITTLSLDRDIRMGAVHTQCSPAEFQNGLHPFLIKNEFETTMLSDGP